MRQKIIFSIIIVAAILIVLVGLNLKFSSDPSLVYWDTLELKGNPVTNQEEAFAEITRLMESDQWLSTIRDTLKSKEQITYEKITWVDQSKYQETGEIFYHDVWVWNYRGEIAIDENGNTYRKGFYG